MTDISFSLVPEWAPQSALWIGWPRLAHDWPEGLVTAREEAANLIRNASRFVPVKVSIGGPRSMADALKRELDEVADLYPVSATDVWLRDTGPIVGFDEGTLSAQAFRFNGWGGRFGAADDRYTAGAIAAIEGAYVTSHDFILEGGSIEIDGEGRLLTTKDCLLNPNRNGGWEKREAERTLRDTFGVDEILWLDRGLVNDHTDGHIDNIARFIGPGHVVCQRASDEDDPHRERLEEIERALRTFSLEVSTIPSPGRVTNKEGDVVPASHCNFIITNGAVLLPTYDEANGAAAAEELDALFPDREIVPLRADHILKGGGGSFHCMSCQIPAFEEDVA
ncbi:agmatine deiminase family protein [Parvularcula marina]|uniref:Agmatine deiminase family protein n=1 Tax=Parvularcula marina TaxID=2292771 RepID=A0A371RIM3_9PROT|nr:agmatine deiminase family protein [Parvularcula marina]RFB05309.1 agmatine deiminase family protein [Parvularcula marina]